MVFWNISKKNQKVNKLPPTRVAAVCKAFIRVCLCMYVCPHHRTKTVETKLPNFQKGYFIISPAYPLNVRSKVKITGLQEQKHILVEDNAYGAGNSLREFKTIRTVLCCSVYHVVSNPMRNHKQFLEVAWWFRLNFFLWVFLFFLLLNYWHDGDDFCCLRCVIHCKICIK